MMKTILMIMMILTILSIGSSRDAAAQALDFTRYQWKNRLLFIFAPNHYHTAFDPLHKSLAAQGAEVSERDLVVFEILESASSNSDEAPDDSVSAHFLRQKFGVRPGDFRVLLIGKDGGIKLDRNDRTELKEIFDLIDSMPMRREEMRQKK